MYLNFFQMSREPFNITPDPRFLFMSPAHREALAAVIYGVEQRKGFVAITGEVGVGKTTVLRAFLDRLDRSTHRVIYLFNANLSFANLLRAIMRELGISGGGSEIFSMINTLHAFLIREYEAGRNLVVIIDEAQNMPVETLENLRMLSNLETSEDKLIQIVFSGQPEFEQLLARKELRQLNQRIAVRAVIQPLTVQESRDYIQHRLAKAMTGEGPVFSSGAINRIVAHAKGIPRVINILCDNSLVTSYGKQKRPVSERTVAEIIADFSGRPRMNVAWRFVQFALLAAVLILTAVAMYVSLHTSAGAGQTSGDASGGAGVKRQETRMAMPAAPVPPQVTAPAAAGEAPPVPVPATVPTVPRMNRSVPDPYLVRKGDTLANLISKRYGYVDPVIIDRVKGINPGIDDVDRIVEGTTIYFPSGQPALTVADERARGDRP